jgi:hypothetical protein
MIIRIVRKCNLNHMWLKDEVARWEMTKSICTFKVTWLFYEDASIRDVITVKLHDFLIQRFSKFKKNVKVVAL